MCFGVKPTAFVRSDKIVGKRAKGRHAVIDPPRAGVLPIQEPLTAVSRRLSRGGERDVEAAAEPEFGTLAPAAINEYPGPGPTTTNAEIEAAAVGMQSGLG
jgi:hypothetical protein